MPHSRSALSLGAAVLCLRLPGLSLDPSLPDLQRWTSSCPLGSLHSVPGQAESHCARHSVRARALRGCRGHATSTAVCPVCQVAGAPRAHTQAGGLCLHPLPRSAASSMDNPLLGATEATGMRERPERSRFPAWAEDMPLTLLLKCFLVLYLLSIPARVWPHHSPSTTGLSVKPLPHPLTYPPASPGQSQSSSHTRVELLEGSPPCCQALVCGGPCVPAPRPPVPGVAHIWPWER